MSRPIAKRRRRVPRIYEPGSGPDKSDQLVRYTRALRELERNGGVSDPALRARIRAGWHPGVEMAIMTTDPNLPDFIKATCLKVLMDHVEVPKVDQLKLAASGNQGDMNITVVVAAWAQGPRGDAPALPPPETAVEVEFNREPDAPRLNSTPASPPARNAERRERMLRDQQNAERAANTPGPAQVDSTFPLFGR